MYRFEDGGLVSKDLDQVLSCISDNIIGIGIGEQGFVTLKEDVRGIFTSGVKENQEVSHSLSCGQIEIRIHSEADSHSPLPLLKKGMNGKYAVCMPQLLL